MSVPYLQRRIDRAEVAFIHDPLGSKGFGMLRSLPAIHYLGTQRFTFPKSWRQLTSPAQWDYLDYEYEVLGDIGPPDSNLCAVSNQNYEDHTEFTLSPVILDYESKKTDGTLIMVADTSEFEPQDGQRPLREQPFVEHLGRYQPIFNHFEDYYEAQGLRCPLSDTGNLFMQDNANIYHIVTGDRVRNTRELFEVLPDAPYLPLYSSVAEIFSRDDQPGSRPLDSYEEIKALGRWLRRRVEWDYKRGLSVARRLNGAVAENERIFDTVQSTRHPKIEEAKKGLRRNRDNSEIHTRYAEWVEELTT